jgi:hypothetical protein
VPAETGGRGRNRGTGRIDGALEAAIPKPLGLEDATLGRIEIGAAARLYCAREIGHIQ